MVATFFDNYKEILRKSVFSPNFDPLVSLVTFKVAPQSLINYMYDIWDSFPNLCLRFFLHEFIPCVNQVFLVNSYKRVQVR